MLIALAVSVGAVIAAAAAVVLVPRARNRRELRRRAASLAAITSGYPIVIPTCDRPRYLRQVLDGLAATLGIERTTVVISQDERHPEVTALIEASPVRTVHLRHTQPQFALLARAGLISRSHCAASNIFFAVDAVFAGSSARGVIVLEDDLVPGINLYRFFEWCFERVLLDPERGRRVLTCGAYNACSRGGVPLSEADALFRETYFSPWSWAITRERWLQVRGAWSFTSWDSAMEHRIMPRLGLVNYRPLLSYVDNVGSHGINGSREEGCTFYRTAPVVVPIEFDRLAPRLLEGGLPPEYAASRAGLVQRPDAARPSEGDTKLLPWLWAGITRRLAGPTRVALKRAFPFL